MKNQLKIGICGAKGSGKDTFAKIVKYHFTNLNVQSIAYADPIKREVCKIFTVFVEDDAQYDHFKRSELMYCNEDSSPHTVLGRDIVRGIGMLMRSYDEAQFVNYVKHRMEIDTEVDIWCITDVRFMNEVDAHQYDVLVKIKRPGIDYDGHISETEIDDTLCDFIVTNDSTILEFEQTVIDLVEHLLERK